MRFPTLAPLLNGFGFSNATRGTTGLCDKDEPDLEAAQPTSAEKKHAGRNAEPGYLVRALQRLFLVAVDSYERSVELMPAEDESLDRQAEPGYIMRAFQRIYLAALDRADLEIDGWHERELWQTIEEEEQMQNDGTGEEEQQQMAEMAEELRRMAEESEQRRRAEEHEQRRIAQERQQRAIRHELDLYEQELRRRIIGPDVERQMLQLQAQGEVAMASWTPERQRRARAAQAAWEADPQAWIEAQKVEQAAWLAALSPRERRHFEANVAALMTMTDPRASLRAWEGQTSASASGGRR